MRTLSRIFAGAFALAFGFALLSSRAGQPSIDQLALQAGVVAWVSAWNPGDKPFNVKKLEGLYHPTVITREAERTLQSWAEYASSLGPHVDQIAEMTTKAAEEVHLQLAERHAETSFVIHPAAKRRDGSQVNATTRVRLVWTKDGGMWRIAEQEIVCSKDSETAPVAAR